jgi:hypothetical protein
VNTEIIVLKKTLYSLEAIGGSLPFPLVWPLCCLSFDLRILITTLVSSNSSYERVEINRLMA